MGPRSSFAAQSVAFGGRLHLSKNETRHLPHYDFQQRLQTHGPFDSECANNYGGPIYPRLPTKNSSKIEKRSCQLYASFCAKKSAGPVRNFEIGVQCAFENLAWPRHFTSQRLPTQHCSGSQWETHEFNHSNLEA